MMRALKPDSNTTWSVPLSSVSLPMGRPSLTHAAHADARASALASLRRTRNPRLTPAAPECLTVRYRRPCFGLGRAIRRGKLAPHRGAVDLAGAVERQLRHDGDEARMRVGGPALQAVRFERRLARLRAGPRDYHGRRHEALHRVRHRRYHGISHVR